MILLGTRFIQTNHETPHLKEPKSLNGVKYRYIYFEPIGCLVWHSRSEDLYRRSCCRNTTFVSNHFRLTLQTLHPFHFPRYSVNTLPRFHVPTLPLFYSSTPGVEAPVPFLQGTSKSFVTSLSGTNSFRTRHHPFTYQTCILVQAYAG
jgi:hypothetical protein